MIGIIEENRRLVRCGKVSGRMTANRDVAGKRSRRLPLLEGDRIAGSGTHHRRVLSILATIGLVAGSSPSARPGGGHPLGAWLHLRRKSGPICPSMASRFASVGLNIYNADRDGWCSFEYSDAQFEQALSDMGPSTTSSGRGSFPPLATTPIGQRDWTRFDRTLRIAGEHGVPGDRRLSQINGVNADDLDQPLQDRASSRAGMPPTSCQTRPSPTGIGCPGRHALQGRSEHRLLAIDRRGRGRRGRRRRASGLPLGNGPADVLRAWAQDVGGVVKSMDPTVS